MRKYEILQLQAGYVKGGSGINVISKEIGTEIWRVDVPDPGSLANARSIVDAFNERAQKAEAERQYQADLVKKVSTDSEAAAPMADWENDLNERRDQGEARDEPQAESGITVADPIVLVDGSNGDEVDTEEAPKRSTWLDPATNTPIGGSVGDISMPNLQHEVRKTSDGTVYNVFNNYPGSIEEDRAQTHIPNRIINGDSPLRS